MADTLPPLPPEINRLISRHNQVSMDLSEATAGDETTRAVRELATVRDALVLAIRRFGRAAPVPVLPAAQTIELELRAFPTLSPARPTPGVEEVLRAAAPREVLEHLVDDLVRTGSAWVRVTPADVLLPTTDTEADHG